MVGWENITVINMEMIYLRGVVMGMSEKEANEMLGNAMKGVKINFTQDDLIMQMLGMQLDRTLRDLKYITDGGQGICSLILPALEDGEWLIDYHYIPARLVATEMQIRNERPYGVSGRARNGNLKMLNEKEVLITQTGEWQYADVDSIIKNINVALETFQNAMSNTERKIRVQMVNQQVNNLIRHFNIG